MYKNTKLFYYLYKDKLYKLSPYDYYSLLIYRIHYGRLFFTQPIVTLKTERRILLFY